MANHIWNNNDDTDLAAKEAGRASKECVTTMKEKAAARCPHIRDYWYASSGGGQKAKSRMAAEPPARLAARSRGLDLA
jgi:hypothetical protein